MFNHNLIFIEIRYQCYGTWYAMRCSGRICVGYTYAAISDTVEILHIKSYLDVCRDSIPVLWYMVRYEMLW